MEITKEKVITKLKKCTSDLERWKVIKASQESGVMILLDNDDTMITFENNEYCTSFDSHIGNAYGVGVLLDMLGIKYEAV